MTKKPIVLSVLGVLSANAVALHLDFYPVASGNAVAFPQPTHMPDEEPRRPPLQHQRVGLASVSTTGAMISQTDLADMLESFSKSS